MKWHPELPEEGIKHQDYKRHVSVDTWDREDNSLPMCFQQ
jgi:hypothetical protein